MNPYSPFSRSLITSFPEALGRHAEDLHEIREAEPDEDGLIECPLIPLRDMVMFPHMLTPLLVGREQSLAAVGAASRNKETAIAVAQIDPSENEPHEEGLYRIGSEVAVGRALRLPDGSMSVLVQGRRRVEIVEYIRAEPYFRVKARPIFVSDEVDPESEALMRAVLALFEKCVELNRSLPEEAYVYAMNVDSPGWLADLVASTLMIDLEDRQNVMETFEPIARLQQVSTLLGSELNVLELEDHIHMQVQEKVDRTQREFYLREQMKAIQTELGEGDVWVQELGELREKITAAAMPEEVHKRSFKEVDRLQQMPPLAPESGVIRTYLEWLIDVPWWEKTEDNLDIAHAQEILGMHHLGLPKAKDRILEFMAVRSLAGDQGNVRQPILCFVGPPGTGKTSLGRSIAEALGRKFVRVSLGGIRDEAEIRGHRRTYIGALPGRILQTMRRAGTVNPLFMLDEIDKLGQDFRGDPSSALLEVLDPEQNHAFSDHYLEVPYDLSRVMFITTANYLGPLPPALEDRLEIIEFGGYVDEEKLAIAKKFLIPRQIELNGLMGKQLQFTNNALQTMIREYTYEAGVRNLEREIANVCRKVARRYAEGKSAPKRITDSQLVKYIGPPHYAEMDAEREDEVGVATGLAWTADGGDLTLIEVSLMEGKGGLQITGQIGNVMQESVHAAMSYMRRRSVQLGIDQKLFDKSDIHLHVPEGAIPKDGPSAGITIATALISAFTGRKVRCDVCMTGEITLRGNVLPVGGLKAKVLTARRRGLKTVILPAKNEKDMVDIPAHAQKDLQLVFVKQMDEVIKVALRSAPRKKVAAKKTKKKAASKKKAVAKKEAVKRKIARKKST